MTAPTATPSEEYMLNVEIEPIELAQLLEIEAKRSDVTLVASNRMKAAAAMIRSLSAPSARERTPAEIGRDLKNALDGQSDKHSGETPRTDAVHGAHEQATPLSDLARQLERELAIANDAFEALTGTVFRLEAELTEAQSTRSATATTKCRRTCVGPDGLPQLQMCDNTIIASASTTTEKAGG